MNLIKRLRDEKSKELRDLPIKSIYTYPIYADDGKTVVDIMFLVGKDGKYYDIENSKIVNFHSEQPMAADFLVPYDGEIWIHVANRYVILRRDCHGFGLVKIGNKIAEEKLVNSRDLRFLSITAHYNLEKQNKNEQKSKAAKEMVKQKQENAKNFVDDIIK